MMKTLIIVCLCTFLLVDAYPPGGEQQGQGQQGQSIEILNRYKRQVPSLGTITDRLGSIPGNVPHQLGMPQPGAVITKTTEVVRQIGTTRVRRQLSKYSSGITSL